MARLTDKTLAQSSAITPTTLIHVVTTGDTSQNSAGSSYKAEFSQIFWSGNCVENFYVTNVYGCSPINFQSEVIFNSGVTATTITTDTYTPSGTTDTGGNLGQITWDNNYLYLKQTGGWVRFSGETW
jgi:hypothetical protein